jgi:anti-sigma factor RsiW
MAADPKFCRESILLLQAEIDGELDAARAITVAAHRASCRRCESASRVIRATRLAVRTRATYHLPTASFRQSLEARLRHESAKAMPNWRIRYLAPLRGLWWQFCAVFGGGMAVATVLTMFLFAPLPQGLSEAVVAGHIRALQPGHLVDVISTESHTVRPWFDGKLDFAPPVKNLANLGFPLEGGRLDYVAKREAAALVYRSDQHWIDLFVCPNPGELDTTPSYEVHEGYGLYHWTQSNMSVWVVSDVAKSKLREFVDHWRSL